MARTRTTSTPWTARDEARLLAAARAAARHAFAPHSKLRVGAAVLARDGRVVPGCNLESLAYGATLCAERAALGAAVAAGVAPADVVAVAVVSGRIDLAPCGVCRQLLADVAPGCLVLHRAGGRVVTTPVEALLPGRMTPWRR